jgi:hypothetical protein
MLIPESVVASLSGGLSLLVAACDAQARPVCCRGVGLEVSADRRRLTLYLPRVTAGSLTASLSERPNVALVLSRPNDYHTVQLKGVASGVREAGEAARATVEAFMEAFGNLVDDLGVPRDLWRRVTHWPCVAIEVAVTEVYLQTPGPGAGASLREPAP